MALYAPLSDVQVYQKICTHEPCGYPIRFVIRLTGCKLTTQPGRSMAEAQYTYSNREIRYYTHDAQDRRVIFCPSCGKKLPNVMEAK